MISTRDQNTWDDWAAIIITVGLLIGLAIWAHGYDCGYRDGKEAAKQEAGE